MSRLQAIPTHRIRNINSRTEPRLLNRNNSFLYVGLCLSECKCVCDVCVRACARVHVCVCVCVCVCVHAGMSACVYYKRCSGIHYILYRLTFNI